MKTGDKLPIIFEVTRMAESGEDWEGSKIDNRRGSLFWASPINHPEIRLLVCSHFDSPFNEKTRNAIIDLIENSGVA